MLKNILIFISGMITMLFMGLIFTFVFNKPEDDGFPGLTLFEQEGACINAKQIKIFQCLASNVALAHALTIPNENPLLDENSTFVLILGEENENFYDDQKIDIKKGKCVKQVGTYRYTAKNGMDKTVPAIEIK